MTSMKDFDRRMAQAKEIDVLQAENARLRKYAQSGAATFEDLYVRDREIARLREQAEALATALRNQGLLQNTFHGTVWHIHDCLREQAEALEEVFRETEHINTRRGSRNGRIREVVEAALRAYREGRDE